MDADAVVRDLVRKYPKGPDGKFKKSDYWPEYIYHNVYERYTTVQFLKQSHENHEWCGYKPEDLWVLVDGNPYEHTCRDLVSNAFAKEHLTSSAITRRARSLLYRLKNAIRHIRSEGTKGTWRIRWYGSGSVNSVYVHCKSKTDAGASAAILAGLFGYDVNSQPDLTFITLESPDKALGRNKKDIDRAVSEAEYSVNSAKDRLLKAQQNLQVVQEKAGIIMTALAVQEEAMHENY